MWTICPIFLTSEQLLPAGLQKFVISCITNKAVTENNSFAPTVSETWGDDLPPECKRAPFSVWNVLGQIRAKSRWFPEACIIDSISMTTNTLKHNKPMLQVPLPFKGLVVIYKSQLSAKLPSPEQYVSDHRRGDKTEGNTQKQASKILNGFCWGFCLCYGNVGLSFMF